MATLAVDLGYVMEVDGQKLERVLWFSRAVKRIKPMHVANHLGHEV